jgi:hypothetical protein
MQFRNQSVRSKIRLSMSFPMSIRSELALRLVVLTVGLVASARVTTAQVPKEPRNMASTSRAQAERSFSTSLTTSVVSRNFCFLILQFCAHLSRQRIRTGFLVRGMILLRMICFQPHGSGPFSSSLWWRSPPDISSVTLDHDVLCKLPSHRGGGQPIQLTRSLLCRTTVEIRHPRLGFPTLPQLSTAAELFVVNLVAHHDP